MNECLALLTDLYELTMAQGYVRAGKKDVRGSFQLFFRRAPFGGTHAIVSGVERALDFAAALRFVDSDIAYLRTLRDSVGRPLFDEAFLDYLRALEPVLDVDGMPEGTVAFAHEPILRVTGPLPIAQIVESALLTFVNFETLIATKASRVVRAAAGARVLEFGLRRAQGMDGALSATRAAFVGGVHATSNLLAGRRFGVPVSGTHAHSWVMAFDSELEAFEAYADVTPDNALFLVDTYDTHEGLANAIRVAVDLRKRGHRFLGVRLDSGDLANLARDARRMLDEADLRDAVVVASSDLDEHRITELVRARVPIGAYGVGTRLVTAFDEPALGGVYKLVAIEEDGRWVARHKRSDDPGKSTLGGRLDAWRLLENGRATRDVIAPVGTSQPGRPLLVPLLRSGKRVHPAGTVFDARERAARELAELPPEVLQLERPMGYPVAIAGVPPAEGASPCAS
jgi:nicotinate phosphoribosyltransferase